MTWALVKKPWGITHAEQHEIYSINADGAIRCKAVPSKSCVRSAIGAVAVTARNRCAGCRCRVFPTIVPWSSRVLCP